MPPKKQNKTIPKKVAVVVETPQPQQEQPKPEPEQKIKKSISDEVDYEMLINKIKDDKLFTDLCNNLKQLED